MIEITLIIITIIAAAFSSYLFGLNQMKSKWLLEAKRRNKSLYKDLVTWQNVYVKAKGGELKAKPPKESSEGKAARKIQSPSEVIAELKEKPILTTPVPKVIEDEFLEKTKQFSLTNTENNR